MLKLLNQYENGNYSVEIYSDGTKVRYSNGNEFIAQFPENIDLKITNYCDAGCAYCHENSTKQGLHGEFNQDFFRSLRSGTELAIGGGNALEHPQLIEFLTVMKEQGVICNLTVNQIHFMRSFNFVQYLVEKELIKGLGVSFMRHDEACISKMKQLKNIVLHVINGIINESDLIRLAENDLKVLILGYKVLRRGKDYYNESVEKKKQSLKENIANLIPKFNVISFDNLALEQLEIKSILSEQEWNKCYMGEDGSHTMYIDLVEQEFALSSTSLKRHKLNKTIDEMFKVVKEESIIAI